MDRRSIALSASRNVSSLIHNPIQNRLKKNQNAGRSGKPATKKGVENAGKTGLLCFRQPSFQSIALPTELPDLTWPQATWRRFGRHKQRCYGRKAKLSI